MEIAINSSNKSDVAYISRLLRAHNYPVFKTASRRYKGVQSGGEYTCYRRSLRYQPFIYSTASLDELVPQVIIHSHWLNWHIFDCFWWLFFSLYYIHAFQVISHPYSIGYATLTDAATNSVSIGQMINLAGNVVKASSASISYAVMEKGGNLDQHFNAALYDGSSALAW